MIELGEVGQDGEPVQPDIVSSQPETVLLLPVGAELGGHVGGVQQGGDPQHLLRCPEHQGAVPKQNVK